jgi:monoamine oxidase
MSHTADVVQGHKTREVEEEKIENGVVHILPGEGKRSGAKVFKIDAHDWNSDPYSLSTWMAFQPGQITRFGAGLRRPEGWLTFATADMAIGWTGYIDGAIESGSRSAERARELLDARAPSAERSSSLPTMVQLKNKGK